MTRPETIHTVHLHGRLGRAYGEEHKLAISSPAEAVRALAVNYPGFLRDLVEGGYYRLVRGEPADGLEYGEEELQFPLGGRPCDFHVIPVAAGAKRGGIGKVILGAVIAIGAVVTGGIAAGGMIAGLSTAAVGTITYGGIAMFGVALMLAGISQMLQPAMDMPKNQTADQRASFLLGGQVNQSNQGGPVPWAFGKIRVGSTVVSAGLETARI